MGEVYRARDPADVLLVEAAFTPDGRYYAYSCFNGLSQPYFVEGWH